MSGRERGRRGEPGTLTCVLCPIGCEIEVGRAGDADPGAGRATAIVEGLAVRGHRCDKGPGFAAEETLRPMRNLSTSVPLRGAADAMVSVRLSRPIPRELLFPALEEIRKLRPAAPVRRGQVLLADVLGTGADVVATRTAGEPASP